MRKSPVGSSASEIGATEFKARCLQLVREVHQHKRNSVTITRRGKAVARLVPIEDGTSALYGCLRGLARVRGDLTVRERPSPWVCG